MAVAGPIKVSANGRYFVGSDGNPFFWLGDTAWPLFTYYTPGDCEAYLNDRAQKGFTVVQCVAAWGHPNLAVNASGTGPSPNWAGEMPWSDSPTDPNPRFFENVDRVLDLANERNLILAIVPTWGYNITDSRVFHEGVAYTYGKWVEGDTAIEPNLIWMNGGDRDATGFESVWRSLARGLREGDGGSHLMTYHPCGWRSSSYWFHNDDWLDFNMIETWTQWPSVYPAVVTDYSMVPTKPVVLGEGAYEDGPEYPMGPITPLIARRQAWWTHMAGGFHTFGQNQMWRMEPGWIDALGSPTSSQMTIFRQVANSRQWWNMVPDQGLFACGVSSERTLNAALRQIDRTGAMLYLSSQTHVMLYLDRFSCQKVRAIWVDPRNGDTQDGGEYATGSPVDGSGFCTRRTQLFSVPDFWEDAVLILDAVE